MKKTIFEEFAKTLGIRSNNSRSAVKVLQTRIWLETLFRNHRLNRTSFETIISGDSEPSGQVLKWLKGINSVTSSKVRQVEKFFPNSGEIYFSPLFQLLENKPISKNGLRQIIKDISDPKDEMFFWRLPNKFMNDNDGLPLVILHENNLECLYDRGGVYSFIAILYLVRLAEANGDADQHFLAMTYAYKSLPSLARNLHFFKRWREIFNALKAIHFRFQTSWLLVRPDKIILEKQINSKSFITHRSYQPRDPITHRFIENESPYRLATFK